MKGGRQEIKTVKVKKETHKKLSVFCAENEVSIIEQASIYIEAGLKGDLANYKQKKK